MVHDFEVFLRDDKMFSTTEESVSATIDLSQEDGFEGDDDS